MLSYFDMVHFILEILLPMGNILYLSSTTHSVLIGKLMAYVVMMFGDITSHFVSLLGLVALGSRPVLSLRTCMITIQDISYIQLQQVSSTLTDKREDPVNSLNGLLNALKNTPIINHALEKKSIASIPVEVTLVFSYEIKALMSDCDKNGHVNQTAYVKWCSDVGVLAADLGRYRNFKKDIGMYALKELSVQYIGETLVDETVLVQTWEDTNEEMTVHFVIKKKDKVIFYAKLKHFDEGLADVGPVTDISGAKL